MTTSSDRRYPPKQLVPEKMFLLVEMYKPPTKATVFTKEVKVEGTDRTEIKEVHQVNLHFRLVDKRQPDAYRQPHILKATDYISENSGLFSHLSAILGDELARALIGKSCFARTWPDGSTTHPDRLVPEETWKLAVGRLFGAEFKAPKLGEDGKVRLDEGGSPFQQIKSIALLAQLGWMEDSWRYVPEQKVPSPLGAPIPVAQQAPLQSPQTPAKEPAKVSALENIRVLLSVPSPLRVVANKFRLLKGADSIGAMEEEDQSHLLALLRIGAHIANGGPAANQANDHLEARKQELHQLDKADAVFLLIWLDKAAGDAAPAREGVAS